MTVEADEFIRRFLLHVLPDGFVKIRYYGLLANRNRKGNIALCRELLGESKIETKDNDIPETWQEHLLRVSGVDVTTCPVCKKGRLITVEILYPVKVSRPSTEIRTWILIITQKSSLNHLAEKAGFFATSPFV